MFLILLCGLVALDLALALSSSTIPIDRVQRFNAAVTVESLAQQNLLPTVKDRLYGSTTSSIDDYPWMSIAMYQSVADPAAMGIISNCVIVTKYWVLSTIYPFMTYMNNDYLVGIVYNLKAISDFSGAMIRGIRQIEYPQEFTGSDATYDVILFRVCPSISSEFIAPLPAPSDTYPAGTPAVLVAYYDNLEIVEKAIGEKCECETYGFLGYTTTQHLCIQCHPSQGSLIGWADYGMVPVEINSKVGGLIVYSQDPSNYYGELAMDVAKFRTWIDDKAVYDELMP